MAENYKHFQELASAEERLNTWQAVGWSRVGVMGFTEKWSLWANHRFESPQWQAQLQNAILGRRRGGSPAWSCASPWSCCFGHLCLDSNSEPSWCHQGRSGSSSPR